MNKRFSRSASAAAFAMLVTTGAWAQQSDISAEAAQQIRDISSVKAGFTPAQKKLGTGLAFGIMAASNDPRVASFSNALTPMNTGDRPASSDSSSSAATPSTMVLVDIKAPVSDSLNGAIASAGGSVKYQSAQWGVTTATVPVASLVSLAERSDVTQIRSPSGARTNVGALTSQGYVSHAANTVVAQGYTGAGVTVGVLSDSASASRIAALKASGDLPPNASVLPGQDGPTAAQGGEDEGTAMMEIVHDMAPNANIIFATAFTSEQSFADNIIALAAAGCKVIVDDVSYFDEGVFQDDIVQRAINQVTAAGVTYFSSAANSGSLTKGTSGTWEGDFKDGGPVTGVVSTFEGGTGNFHNFATTGTQNYDVLNAATTYITLKWSDPLGNSANDYDLIVLNAAGTAILGFGGDVQNGPGGEPFEIAYRTNGAAFPAGSRIVVVRYSGATRALHLDTLGGTLSIATSGTTFGHNAGGQTMSIAATYWNSAKTGAKPFTGFANTNEIFSSDGPRRIFYTPAGLPITPGNILFATNGGTVLQKPDVAAADGVSTKTPGFLPFFGTSAAAPHAAGIAALVLSARPNYTPDQVKAAIRNSALDSMSPGLDRDSGYGVAMANAAVQYALTHP